MYREVLQNATLEHGKRTLMDGNTSDSCFQDKLIGRLLTESYKAGIDI